MTFRTVIIRILFLLVIAGLLSLVLRHMVPLLRGPVIAVTIPVHGASYEDSLIMVSGTTRRATRMTLNGQTVLVREDGIFEVPTLLIDGINVVEIQAADKFGRSSSIALSVFKKGNIGN